MKLTKIIREADYFPRGYGIAWRVWDRKDAYVCLPIPLNVVARAIRVAFFWAREAHFATAHEDAMANTYMRGFEDGRATEAEGAPRGKAWEYVGVDMAAENAASRSVPTDAEGAE